MKKLLAIISIISVLLISCDGQTGPPGRDGLDGLDGLDGVNILGQIFEAQVDFNIDNQFSVLVDFPEQIEVFDTDVVIAYVLVGSDNELDIWEPLPQTLFFDDGILLYGFNYTVVDIQLFLDGTVNLNDLLPELTQDIIFRIAILPADAAQNLDLNNFDNVMKSLKNPKIIKLN
jgi:hypothetical protein